MRTILRTRDASGQIQLFSFETSPLLNQQEQIDKAVKEHNLQDFEIIDWQCFRAHELSTQTNYLHKRFKMLYFLMEEAGILQGVKEKQIEELANRIDDQDEQAEEALSFFEEQVIKALEAYAEEE